MARRRQGQLLPIEVRILESGLELQRDEAAGFHGFALAKRMSGRSDGKGLTAHGTLYKALGRMTDRGLLADQWEDPEVATAEGRPRRRLYRVTGPGEVALREANVALMRSARGSAAAVNPKPATI